MIPSIQSPAVIANGSYSRRLKVVQLGDTIVAVPTMAVIEPFVAVCTVTLRDVALTKEMIPVTSSMKSNEPEDSELNAGGRIIAVKTSAAPRFTLVIVCVFTFRVNDFAIFTFTAKPVL